MNSKNEKRGGYYWVGEKPYLSVTTILGCIDKPALRYWYGQQVYYAMVKDPTLGEKEALAAPYAVNNKAKDRGSAVHSIVEAWKNTGNVVGVDSIYGGYAKAFECWLSDFKVTIVENERTVFSKEYNYCGTLDMLAKFNGDELPTLVDVKTGKDLYPEVHLQMSAYRQALEEDGIKVKGTSALLLREDGTYKYEQGQDRLAAFLACKTLYEGLNHEKLDKVNYFQEGLL